MTGPFGFLNPRRPDGRFHNFTVRFTFTGQRGNGKDEREGCVLFCGHVVDGGGGAREPAAAEGTKGWTRMGSAWRGPRGRGGAHARPRAAAGFSPRPAGRPDPKPRSTPIMRARASVAARPRRHGTAPSPPLAAVAGTGESRPPAAGLTPRTAHGAPPRFRL